MPAPAAPFLAEALDWFAAQRIEVLLAPVNGLWRYLLDGHPVSEGEIVARAVVLGMMGHETVQ